MDAFGEILRKLRLAKGLSREKLAEIAGVSPVIVRNVVKHLAGGDFASGQPQTASLNAY